MERYPQFTRARLKQLAARMKARIYADTRRITELWDYGPTDRITLDEAQKLRDGKVCAPGRVFGPEWATFWIRGNVSVPMEWAGRRVDLIWIAHNCEGTLWIDGKARQGLNWNHGKRPDAVLVEEAKGGESFSFQIELACSGLFGQWEIETPFDSVSPYVLDRAEIGLFDPDAWRLYFDYAVLQQLEEQIALEDSTIEKTRGGQLLFELNRFANAYDPDDRGTWDDAASSLSGLYEQHNATTTHEMSAIGHAHIDTAWLWPLSETWRKCERTFASQIAYMDVYPDFRFACSQAQQYEAIKRRNPELYARIKERVERGQWIPTGGTWVEPDCNLPSGESLVRQFLYGQRFFEKEFGTRCAQFWNPDVFGYNAQLPQIMRLAGIRHFLTQKLSWNKFNRPRYHTFLWEALDGSQVVAHFPPADTYNADATIPEIRKNVGDYNDHDRSRHSLYVFGHGDGGGGPTKEMIEVLRRCRDVQGLPRTQMRTPAEFFELLESDCPHPPRMVGELYFEYHRGTYTSQAEIKQNNRRAEFLLHDIEFLGAMAARRAEGVHPGDELQRLWKVVLLNQFHDILPGSSIRQVYDESASQFADVFRSGRELRNRLAAQFVGKGDERVPINTLGFDRRGVVDGPDGEPVFITAPMYAAGRISEHETDVTLVERDGYFVFDNAYLTAKIDESGKLVGLFDKIAQREALSEPGNMFELYEDLPLKYDAWEIEPYHVETKTVCDGAISATVSSTSALRAEVAFEYRIGDASRITQNIRLDASSKRLEFHCYVDWHESHKLLKVMFPVNVRALDATYEMQFGHVQRPTHFNTTYDLARFEVPAHKWMDLSEHDFGVALLSDSKYGFSAYQNEMRMTLLRSPKSPDPDCDMGAHHFAFALMPHYGSWQSAGVVREAFAFNKQVVWAKGNPSKRSLVRVEDNNLVLDTIKRAEDSDALILRFYEAHGARGAARVRLDLPFSEAVFCNILEDDGEPAPVADAGVIIVEYTAFQIITVKVR